MAGLVDRIHRMINPPDDEYEDYYDDETEGEEEEDTGSSSRYDEPRHSVSFSDYVPRRESSERKWPGVEYQRQGSVPGCDVSPHQFQR